jgi:hypothetical protein
VLYQLATGRLPLDIRSPERALQAHQYEEVAAPRAVHAGVPAAVEAVIMRALARRPENRYQTAEELAADLRRVAGTLSNEEARAFSEDTDSAIVSMVTEFPTPTRRLEWDARPRTLRDEGVCRVLLQNHSPSAQTVALAVETPKGGLYVDAARKQITLAPGQKGVVDFYLQGMRRPSVGRARSYPFVVHVMPSSQPAEAGPGMDGQVTIAPPLPLWLAALLVVLVLALCALGVWTLASLPALESLLSSLGL